MTDLPEFVDGQPLAAVCLTVAAYALAETLWRRSGGAALLNPVLVASAVVAAILLALGVPCERYIEQARPINDLLPLIIILLAVSLCRKLPLIRAAGLPLIGALAFGSVVALATALIFPAFAGEDAKLIATLAPKFATAARRRGGVRGSRGRGWPDGGNRDLDGSLRRGVRAGAARSRGREG